MCREVEESKVRFRKSRTTCFVKLSSDPLVADYQYKYYSDTRYTSHMNSVDWSGAVEWNTGVLDWTTGVGVPDFCMTVAGWLSKCSTLDHRSSHNIYIKVSQCITALQQSC